MSRNVKKLADFSIGFLLLVNLSGLFVGIWKDNDWVATILVFTTMWLWAMYIADGIKEAMK